MLRKRLIQHWKLCHWSFSQHNTMSFNYKSKTREKPKEETRQTLIGHSAAIRFKEWLNHNLMSFIQQKVSQMEELEKLCVLVWDEMSLSSSLQSDHIKDYIDGFEDHGSKRTNNFATHALVFMVRGVKSPYKQPISYYLTESLKSTELSELVSSAVMDTDKAAQIYWIVCLREVTIFVFCSGLQVIGSVCDATYVNYAAVNKLIGLKDVRGDTLGQLLEYTINGTKICHIFDPPHLVKSIRNNLQIKNLGHSISFNETKFKSNGSVVWNEKKKKTSRNVQHRGRTCSISMTSTTVELPKITPEHMNPTRGKMKVNLATQVFSGTYGRNMYMSKKSKHFANDCIGTAAVLLFSTTYSIVSTATTSQ